MPPGAGGRAPNANISCDDKTFGPKKTAQRSPASSHISAMSSSVNYLVVKVGLGGFQGKFKLLWLQRCTHGSAGMHLPTCGAGMCVWLFVAKGEQQGPASSPLANVDVGGFRLCGSALLPLPRDGRICASQCPGSGCCYRFIEEGTEA